MFPKPETSANRLLSLLPKEEYRRLLPELHPVHLEFKQVLYEQHSSMDFAYFPESGMISLLLMMEAGSAIEVATIGNEGMMGLPILMGEDSVPYRYFMQSEGTALRMKAGVLRRELDQGGPLQKLLLRYNGFFLTSIMRCTGCNGLHTVPQRCCRWILISQDRLQVDTLPITHEFLALMLGVRRASVTEVLASLQERGLITSGQGIITVLNRRGLEEAACECYRAVVSEYERLFGRK